MSQSRAVEDYLKAIHKLQQRAPSVSTSVLAEELDRSAASVTNMVKGLAEQGLAEHIPYHGVRLTDAGELSALRIIRRHRVLEMFLIDRLGYAWDDVHEEAERLEHAASDELIDRMAQVLGEPRFDPHGAPIPTRDGRMEHRALCRLTELPERGVAIIRRVTDESSDTLRRLAELGLYPGARVRLVRRDDARGRLVLEVDGSDAELEATIAQGISVESV